MIIKVHDLPVGRIFLIKLTLLAGCLCCYKCTPQEPLKSPKEFNAAKVEKLNQFIHNFRESFPIPGISIAIVSNDSVYYTALGVSDASNHPFTTTTPFLAGSVSEPMLATAVLKLADEGELDLDKPVIEYLPYFKMAGDNYKKVTVRHLLTHTSGVQHYNIMWDAPNFKADALEITTKSIASQQPQFKEPGTRVSRSPYNYDILADVVSKVTGKPFEAYLKMEVFNRLGMSASAFSKPKKTAMPFHINNWLTYTTKPDSLYPYNRENGGSGGFHTTAKDISTWMFAVLNKGKAGTSLTDQKVYEQMLSAQFKNGKQSAIGFGWEIKDDGKQKIYLKGSQYGGFSNQVILIPGKKIGVAVTSNVAGDYNPANISRLVAAWLNGGQLIMPKIPISMAMGKAMAKSGNMKDAFKAYVNLKITEPDKYDFSSAALSQFGVNMLHRIHNKEKALQAFQFCVAQYPASAYAYLNLAEGYVFIKDVKNTRLALTKAKALPDDSGVKASYLAYLQENLEILEEKKS
jgi:CubicO group peptidase (beta-lactamase class C family)